MLTNGLKLGACERCRSRKSKCDGAVPKCTSCTKSGSACIVVDSATQERLSRDAVHELELRLQELESRRVERSQVSPGVVSPSSATHRRHQSLYVGDGSGLNLFTEVSRNAGGHDERVQLLREPGLTVTSPSTQRRSKVHLLPAYDEAARLVDRYLSHSYLHHPFLAWHDVHDTLSRVYSGNAGQTRPDDLYRLLMLFAITTVTMFRRGETDRDPYGYYHAAQAASGGVRMDGTTRCIQNVLLIARFAMYCHIDCSIWDLSRLCMRQCVELGLHRPPTRPMSPTEEQVNRNIFWDCYVHDRYSSGIMGRPYAISEEDITVKVPVPLRERDIAALPITSLDEIDLEMVALPNDACVPLFVIKLRQTTTHIQKHFFGNRDLLPNQSIREAAKLQAKFDQYWEALDSCLADAPRFDQPQSLYQRPQWYEFLVEKDRLLLIRGMMLKQPIHGLKPSPKLLQKCLRCAGKVIMLYSQMYELRQITWTRSYFQINFTSGLSLMHALSGLDARICQTDRAIAELRASSLKALSACRNILYELVREMPDVARFAYIFDALSRQVNGANITAQASDAGQDDHPSFHAGGHQNLNFQNRSDYPEDLRASNVNTTQSQNGSGTYDGFLHPADTQHSGLANDGINIPFEVNDFELPELPFDFDLSEYQAWPNFAQTDNVLGQMEAGLGEYAWGYLPNDSAWNQYFA